MEFVDLYQARDHFRDEIIRQIGDDLSGYVLEDAAIDYLEQTPLSKLDGSNILDAQGIKKITELTAVESVRTNELRRNEEMQIKKKNVETQETMLELDRQAADAQARQSREVASVRAREESETAKVQAEERTKSEMARLQGEQLVAVQTENSQREKEVAENNRKRAVAIEEEKVTRARELEVVDREKEVALQKIDKERALEVQKKAIADVIRERIVVDRTVAEQEEAIKELRMVSEAERNKKSTIILAEGEAEQKMITEVKAAEAQERRARHKAAEDITLADAHLKVAEKNAESKKRDAEGMEAIGAAPGLAAARVMTVTADAKQKQGMAEAQVIEATSLAEANGMKAKFDAEAQGKEKLGLAEVQVRTAGAEATIKVGDADAQTVQARFSAEAKGLREKFEAMKAMSPETRDHEEFRMRLEMLHTETLKGIEAQMAIAKEQAEVLGKALANAKIEMVGGDGSYFDSFVSALAVGKGIDGAIAKSDTLKIALKDHLNGDRNMVDDVGRLVGALGDSSSELKDLAIASLLNKTGKDGKGGNKAV
jgi:uncharacterized membrane protein YqiK